MHCIGEFSLTDVNYKLIDSQSTVIFENICVTGSMWPFFSGVDKYSPHRTKLTKWYELYQQYWDKTARISNN